MKSTSYLLILAINSICFGSSILACTDHDCKRLDPAPGNMASYSTRVNECFEMQITGGASGSVWGSGIYTADSTLARSAVHAGVVKQGETKLVRVRVLPGQSSYQSTNQNGFASSSWGNYGLSYKFVGAVEDKRPADFGCKSVDPAPTDMASYSSHVNTCFWIRITGASSGSVWGSGIYTADSTLARSAVHAGVVKQGETKLVRVQVLPGQSSYQSTNQNTVLTTAYGNYGLSYKFLGASEDKRPILIGCFFDDPKYPDFFVVAGREAMTVGKCNDLCRERKYAYFSLENGTFCNCGGNYGNSGQVAPGLCNKPCSGNAAEQCGGTSHHSVFIVQ